MKTLLSTVAVVALLATGPALAAETVAPAPTDQPAAADQTKTDMMNKAPAAAAAPAATDQTKTAEAPAAADQSKTAAASTDQPKFVTQQTDQENLASKVMGKTIYNQSGESIGKVNDLVIGQNGQIDAVVVGVGGFLGIGEKSVAVPFNAVQAATDSDGNLKLTAQLSKDDVNKAPEFMTLADLKAKSQAPAAPASPSPAPAQ